MPLAPSSELAHLTAFGQLAPEFTSEVLGSTGFFFFVPLESKREVSVVEH